MKRTNRFVKEAKKEQIMTPKEFKEAMQEIKDRAAVNLQGKAGYYHRARNLEGRVIFGSDVEVVHIQMDSLMAEVLEKLGYKEGIKIFKETNKWYA